VLARDIMEPALIVAPEAGLQELAHQLLASDSEGACVCDASGKLVGVVTGMDLVFREKKVHAGFRDVLRDLVMGFAQTARELERIAATRVDELMATEVLTVVPTTPLDQVASLMVQERISTVPVIDRGAVVGMISRRVMIATALNRLLAGRIP